MKAAKYIRILCAVIFFAGLIGIIVSSAAGNNEGVVLSIGITTAIAAVVLIAVNASVNRDRIDAFEDALVEKLEAQIAELVAAGADESKVRALVREALRTGAHQ